MTAQHDNRVECRLSTYTFNSNVAGTQVHFSVLRMLDSFMLWIGTQPAELANLSMAIMTKFDQVPLASAILGNASESSSSLAQKLAKRSKKQVFVSYNLPSGDRIMSTEVEKRIIEEMTVCPENF